MRMVQTRAQRTPRLPQGLECLGIRDNGKIQRKRLHAMERNSLSDKNLLFRTNSIYKQGNSLSREMSHKIQRCTPKTFEGQPGTRLGELIRSSHGKKLYHRIQTAGFLPTWVSVERLRYEKQNFHPDSASPSHAAISTGTPVFESPCQCFHSAFQQLPARQKQELHFHTG